MPKILILDANQRSALAATRSLGSKGLEVVAADETQKTLAGSSKYCSETFVYPSPYEHPEEFLGTLLKESSRRNIKVVFPMTEISAYLVLKHRDDFKDIAIPFPSFEAFDRLSDKWKLLELAQKLGLPVPATYFIKKSGEISDIISKLNFPVVIKPCRSKMLFDGKWIGTSVRYARSVSELAETVKKIQHLDRSPFLVQDYIQGEGQGMFSLYDCGTPVVFFSHRRLREKPPSGGVSVLSESVRLDLRLREIARTILDRMEWHGVAMVEFKVSSDGKPYLMEINPRFWGSLQLAVDAGVDFPHLLYKLAVGEKLGQASGYKIGVKNRWLLGDLDHLYLTFKNHAGPNLQNVSRLKAMANFLNFFDKNTRFEVNRWDDPGPFWFELKRYIARG